VNIAEPGSVAPIRLIDPDDQADAATLPASTEDPAAVVMTCANCGATMDERKCKLICRCGYFMSCSDYY
jgi:hypothetical protein